MNKQLEERNHILFAKLVPFEGHADTLEGEMLRAINRICYRYYNDGDYWYEGYGCETAGPAETFLRNHSPVPLVLGDGLRGKAYEEALEVALGKVLTFIEGRTQYVPNMRDMLDCDSLYEEEYC